MRQFKRLFLDRLLDLVLPPTCPGCLRQIAGHGSLCAACWSGLQFLEKPWCERLGTPFAWDPGEGTLSGPALAEPPPFDRLRSAVAHEGLGRRLVVQLKFHDRTELADLMARWMLRAGGELVGDAELIVPVPLHRRRLLWRRYNQAAELARAIARICGLPHVPQAVRRTRMTRRQVGLGARDREANVRGAFLVPARCKGLVAGRRVLVIDDVYTTGATVAAVTRALRHAGAAGVDVLTFARVLPGALRADAARLYTGVTDG